MQHMDKGFDGFSRQSIVNYYDQTQWDYYLFWFGNSKIRSMHFGYSGHPLQPHKASLENMDRKMAEKAGIRPGDRILDAGCGQGGAALWLGLNFKDITVEGVTLVPHQAAIAKKQTEKYHLGHMLNFRVGDFCSTDFPAESFTVVWACESVCHVDDKSTFYKEAYRILKPGGRLVMTDGIRKDRNFPEEDEALLRSWLAGWCCPDLDTWEEHLSQIRDAGFGRSQMEDLGAFVQPSLGKLYTKSRQALPLGRLLYWLKIRNKISHNNLLSAVRQYEAFKKGLWTYGLILAIK